MRATSTSIYKQLLPGLFLGIIVLIGLVILAGLTQVGEQITAFHWINFALAVALNFLAQSMRFLKRAINLNKSGVKNVNLLESMRLFVACMPLSVTPSRIEESFKGIWLFKKSGIPVERAISVFYVDQISDGLSVFALMVIGTIAYPSLWPLFAGLFLAFLAVLVYFKIPRSDSRTSVVSDKVPVLKRIIPQMRESIEANPSLFSVANLLITCLLGMLAWAAEGTALFVILRGLDFTPTLHLVATSVLVFAFSATVSIASRLPGGLGIMEVAMALLLTLLLNFQPEKAVTATVLFRLATFWVTFICGIILWSMTGKSLGIHNQEGRILES